MQIKLGLCGAIHPNMPGDDTGIFKNIIEQLEKMKEPFGFDLVVAPNPMRSEEDSECMVRFLNEQHVDFTLLITPSLGNGRVMLPMAKLSSYLGLWALPEPANNGVLQLNSFCGLNMFSAILDKYWRNYDIPFKWFYGYPDTEMFQERFAITLRAMRGIKAVREARIGVIGDVANGFENFIFDERELEAKLGTYVYTRHSVPDLVRRAESVSNQNVDVYMKDILKEGRMTERVAEEQMKKSVRLMIAFEQFAKENRYDALAINCWPTFQEYYDLAVCSVLSHLNQVGIVATCEADVPGAINMLMLNAISGGTAALMDLVSIDEADNSVNLWHCGPAPACFADARGVCWDAHFNIGNYCDGKWCGKGVVADLSFRDGPLTIARTSSNFDDLFVLSGQVLHKEGFSGSSGWMGHLQMGDVPLDAAKFIETLIGNRIDHHFPVAYGDLTNELYEAAAWLNLKVTKPLNYVPYMRRKPER